MTPTTHGMAPARQPRRGWGLAAIVAAACALALAAAALLVIPRARVQQPEMAPASSPEGVVQRFFDAAYRGDYASAYAMLSAATRKDLTLAQFQERLRYERDSEMRVERVATYGATATVSVTVTHYAPDSLFGEGEWSARYDIMLERDGEAWRIVGSPFW